MKNGLRSCIPPWQTDVSGMSAQATSGLNPFEASASSLIESLPFRAAAPRFVGRTCRFPFAGQALAVSVLGSIASFSAHPYHVRLFCET
jgi:hypothetical protein